MFERLQRRAETTADRAARRASARIADALDGDELRAVATERGVTISGRKLIRRMFDDDRLRWIGGLFR